MPTFWTLTWIELKLFVREPLNLVFVVAFPALVVLIMGSAFGNTPDPEGVYYKGLGPMNYYIPAYLGLAISALGLISIPVHLAAYRERGVLRRFRASGLPAWTLVSAVAIVTVVLAIVGSVVLIVTGALLYDVARPRSLLGVILAFLISALAFAAVGVLLGALIPTARAAQGIGLILFFVMMFLGGAAPPREVFRETFGGILLRIGDGLLLTHSVDSLVDPWNGLGTNAGALVIVGVSAIVAGALAVRLLRWD